MQLVIVVTALSLIILNCLIGLKAFQDGMFYRKCILHIDGILISKQYARLISAGFVHESWTHLFFQMFVLLSFSVVFASQLMLHSFLLAYVGGLLGGNILALYTHRHEASFQSAGTAGAISGLMFSIIILFPEQELQLFFLPIHLPSWVYGIIILLYSMFSLRASNNRIMYEEHIGGLVAGVLLTLLLQPSLLQEYPVLCLGFMFASALFLFLVIRTKHEVSTPSPLIEAPIIIHLHATVDAGFHSDGESELNYLLDEVTRIGFQKLSLSQKQRLQELSQDPGLRE